MICSYHKYKSIKKKLSITSNNFSDLLVSLPLNENIDHVKQILANFIESDESDT